MSRTAFAIISSAILLAGAAALPAAASTDSGLTATGSTAPPRSIFVDDDRTECPQADFTSVQAAIQEASPGALVRVCPGVYTEFVNVDKPVRLFGQIGAVDNIDCFDPSASQPGDLDPTTYAILNRPTGEQGNLLTVTSGGATVAGLVLQGATGVDPERTNIVDAAVHLQSDSAGSRIHHNLIRLSSLGIDLGSDGSATTRVDHNCLRGELAPNTPTRSTWGMASQRQDFVGGTVDHNETFGHRVFAYEIGWTQASTRDSAFTSNTSRDDTTTFFVQNSSHISIADNDAEPTDFGVRAVTGNQDLNITDNRLFGGSQIGVLFQPFIPQQPAVPASTTARVTGNEIAEFRNAGNANTGFAIGLGFVRGVGAIHGVLIENNVLRDSNLGLSVNPDNTGVVVRSNTITGNNIGILSRVQSIVNGREPTYGHRYEQNVILGNGLDARDDNRRANKWVRNVCSTDQTNDPALKICGVDDDAVTQVTGEAG